MDPLVKFKELQVENHNKLVNFILTYFPGKPSGDYSAEESAIIIMKGQQNEIVGLNREIADLKADIESFEMQNF